MVNKKTFPSKLPLLIGTSAIIVAFILLLVFLITSVPFTGRATEPVPESEAETIVSETIESGEPEAVCSGTQCNPQNTQQICSNGQWIQCLAEQVCSLGACTTPLTLSSPVESFVSGGGGGGSSGGSGSGGGGGGGENPAPTETTRSIGEVSGATIEDIAENEKLIFTLSAVEHTLKVTELTASTATLQLKNSASLTLSVGGEQAVNDDANSQTDFILKLKSVNPTTNTARVLITQA